MLSKNLLDSIKNLSLQDKKTLSQKVLKTTEELGELAKVILPIDGAYATRHRFAIKEKALEEVSDTILCLLSVAYDLGFDHSDVSDMIETKMKVWSDLQSKEGLLNLEKIPFEMHVTVSGNCVLEYFKESCISIDVKPVLLDLQLNDNTLLKDLMTSSTFMGTNQEAFYELKRISNALKDRGFKVLREKIETVPWHPAAPAIKYKSSTMPKNCYFESHLAVTSPKNKLDKLSEIAKMHNAKRSTNVFKKLENDYVKVMVTLRSGNLFYEPFLEKLHILKDSIIENEFSVDKEIVEFSIFDTNLAHDNSWINL